MMASQKVAARFINPHTHLSLGIIARYVKGEMKASITLSGLEANEMRRDLLDPDFTEAVRKLGFTAEILEKEKKDEKGGVMHVVCKSI